MIVPPFTAIAVMIPFDWRVCLDVLNTDVTVLFVQKSCLEPNGFVFLLQLEVKSETIKSNFPPRPFIIPHFQFLAVAPAVPEKLIVASEIVNPDS